MNLSKLVKAIVVKNTNEVLKKNNAKYLFLLDDIRKLNIIKIDRSLEMVSCRFLKGYKDKPIMEEELLIHFWIQDLRSFSAKFKTYKLSIPADQSPVFVSKANKSNNL